MLTHSESFKDVTKGINILLSGEFKIPVYFDQGFNLRRSMYFSVEPVSSNIVELRGESQVREYILNIKHYWHRGVKNFGARSNHQKVSTTNNRSNSISPLKIRNDQCTRNHPWRILNKLYDIFMFLVRNILYLTNWV